MVIPVYKTIWLILFYFGFMQKGFYFIGHSFEYDLLLLLLSFMFRHCLWHKILIFDCMIALLFQYLQEEKGIFLSVSFTDFAYVLIIIAVIATLTFFANGVIFKKNNHKGFAGVD